MRKIVLAVSVLTFSSGCLSFDGISGGSSNVEEMLMKYSYIRGEDDVGYELSSKNNETRFIFVPKVIGDVQEKSFEKFMRSCDECMEVPIVDPGEGPRLPPVTGYRELCEKYPFLKECEDERY